MCGIITQWTDNGTNVDTMDIVRRYDEQKTRGREGFGFSYLTKAGRIQTRRFVTEAECFHSIANVRSSFIMMHHRFPTSTTNNAEQNQPITNVSIASGKKYIIVHNGIIHNHYSLTEKHPEECETYNKKTKTYNDSEALLIDMMHAIEEKREATEAEGSIAFILLECNTEGIFERMHYARNINPLYCAIWDEHKYSLSSTHPTLPLKDIIPEGTLWTLEWNTKEFTCRPFTLPTYTAPKPVVYVPPLTPRTCGTKTPSLQILSSEHKSTRGTWHARYESSIVEGEDMLKYCETMDAERMTERETMDLLSDIDKTIQLMTNAWMVLFTKEPRRVEDLRKMLIEEREFFMPIKTASDDSIMEALRKMDEEKYRREVANMYDDDSTIM